MTETRIVACCSVKDASVSTTTIEFAHKRALLRRYTICAHGGCRLKTAHLGARKHVALLVCGARTAHCSIKR